MLPVEHHSNFAHLVWTYAEEHGRFRSPHIDHPDVSAGLTELKLPENPCGTGTDSEAENAADCSTKNT